MPVFKVGRTYWYEFVHRGVRYRKSTRLREERAAMKVEADAFAVASGAAPPKPVTMATVPTLREFEATFISWCNRELPNQRTRGFYRVNYGRLLQFKPLAMARLNDIDEAMIEQFKIAMDAKQFGQTVVNRYLTTLRKALRYASRTLRLFDRVPIIKLYPNERQREFVFNDEDYQRWLNIAPEPLRSASVLARECGICRNEMLSLERDCVLISDEPDEKGLFGDLNVHRGLKRKERKRQLPITRAMHDVIMPLLKQSQCQHLFTATMDATQPLPDATLENQLSRTKAGLKLHRDAGLHALRHTFLTEMAKRVDAFTLQRIAGHVKITTTMRYVQVQKEAIKDAFAQKFSQTAQTVPLKFPLLKKGKKRNAVGH